MKLMVSSPKDIIWKYPNVMMEDNLESWEGLNSSMDVYS